MRKAVSRGATHNQLAGVARRYPPNRAREFTLTAARAELVHDLDAVKLPRAMTSSQDVDRLVGE